MAAAVLGGRARLFHVVRRLVDVLEQLLEQAVREALLHGRPAAQLLLLVAPVSQRRVPVLVNRRASAATTVRSQEQLTQ